MRNIVILWCMFAFVGFSGTICMTNGAQITNISPVTKSNLSQVYYIGPFAWSRMRITESQGEFSEKYSLNLDSQCEIRCGPYAWPVQKSGAIFCKRDLSKYYGVNVNGAEYKTYCIPDISKEGFLCDAATSFIYSNSNSGGCDANLMGSAKHYDNGANAGTFDCCNNNFNSGTNHIFNVYTDKGAIIE